MPGQSVRIYLPDSLRAPLRKIVGAPAWERQLLRPPEPRTWRVPVWPGTAMKEHACVARDGGECGIIAAARAAGT